MHFISEDLENYVANHSQQEPELLVKLNKETHQKIAQPKEAKSRKCPKFNLDYQNLKQNE